MGIPAFPSRLLGIAALVAAGSALGIQLGRAAIAEIDPIHYAATEPERFFADLTPAGYRPDHAATYEQADFWARDAQAPARPFCVNCATDLEVTPTPSSEPSAGTHSDPEPAPMAGPDTVLLERYANFPVTQDEVLRSSSPASSMRTAKQGLGLRPESAEPAGM